VFIIDEAPVVSMHLWARLAPWEHDRRALRAAGRPPRQFRPIGEDHLPRAFDLRFVHGLAGGLHVEMRVNRRGSDPDLFRRTYGDRKPFVVLLVQLVICSQNPQNALGIKILNYQDNYYQILNMR
jgi:hypothetical protein